MLTLYMYFIYVLYICALIASEDLKKNDMVGAAGFEPTITGSKPDALPLGYAPLTDGPFWRERPLRATLSLWQQDF